MPPIPAARDVPYAPGAIAVEVDATNLGQRIFRVKQSIPVQAGHLVLLYPQWLPGNHAPRGPIDKIAGIVFEGLEQAVQLHGGLLLPVELQQAVEQVFVLVIAQAAVGQVQVQSVARVDLRAGQAQEQAELARHA